jgi:tripeptidyl-peptidase II
VDTSTVVEANEDGSLTGLTGRTLKLNPAWVNPSGKWHLGIKRAFELYPNMLKPRVKGDRKKEFTLKVRVESR